MWTVICDAGSPVSAAALACTDEAPCVGAQISQLTGVAPDHRMSTVQLSTSIVACAR